MDCQDCTPSACSLLWCPSSSAHLTASRINRSTVTIHFFSPPYATELLKYNIKTLLPQIAANYDCVKYALVSFSAYTHFQATKSPISEEVCISHANIALRELQKEIDHFGPSNADAVIIASVALTGATQDWEQWAVFVDGYSKALTQMRDSKYPTLFPDLLGERFQLRKFSSMSNPTIHAIPEDRGLMRRRVTSITDSILDARGIIGTVKWQASGFAALETLARTVDFALSLEDEIETYHQLAWLRSWMFWIDLRQTDDSKQEHMLNVHFYALLLAVVPLFPARYQESLAEACKRIIQVAKLAISGGSLLLDREGSHEIRIKNST
ncbi:hypothetical protein D0Z07_4504 [Hyphodiscus hymeniophilus]|uniref:Uncharacterized protein n=1 Tax=Hyphodiscus hymeniophilus TaxID=353542 RepID=A0A9P6VJU9_9HELO|nr:hypothetical protein D0Z07_4504 [Hyphodiscus hymeniophilus]